MATIPGSVSVSGFVAPTDSTDTFPSHSEEWGRGGYRTVASISERNAISTARRKKGMKVFVDDSDKITYRLEADLTTWTVSIEDRIESGCLIVQAVNQRDQYFTAEEDSNDSRVAALLLAMAAVPAGGKIVVKTGSYIVGDSLLALSLHTDWKFQFEQGAWLAYEDPNYACDSWFAYEGDHRYAEQFGIIPWDAVSSPVDMQPRIQAALFSMPPTGDIPEPAYEYPDVVTRKGKLFFKNGQYPISRSIYFTSFQQIYGAESRGAVLSQLPGFGAGNPADEKFSLHHLRAESSPGQPVSQFGFEVVVENLGFYNMDPDGNTDCSYLLMGGAQFSYINNIFISNHSNRGIVYHDNSAYFEIGRLWLVGSNPNQTGPLLDIYACLGFKIDTLSIEVINNFPSGSRKTYVSDPNDAYPTTTNLMGVCIAQCRSFTICNLNGELVSTLIRLTRCFNFKIGPCSVHQALGSGIGEEMVSIGACKQYSIGPFFGQYFEKLWAVYVENNPQTLQSRCLASNAPYGRTGIITDGQSFGVPDGDLEHPNGICTTLVRLQRAEPPEVYGETAAAKNWIIAASNTATTNSVYIQSLDYAGTVTSTPLAILPPGGTAGFAPIGFTVVLDAAGAGGVHVGRYFNVGNAGDTLAYVAVNEDKILGERGAAVANAVDALGAPTQAEFNALVTQFNTLLDRLRFSSGHGIIEG